MAHTVIPRLSVEDREKSLGWLALWWVMSFTLIGRGGGVGLPVDYAPEFERFIVDCYALDHRGRRRFPHVFLSRAKGSDKSGKGAAIAMFEGFGPCRFAGWAEGGETYTFLGQTYIYSPGEPMGRPVQNPEVICAATAEGQTGNVFDTIYYNCTQGPLSELAGYGMDAGKARIGLPEGGEIVPSTTGAASHDGGIETFAVVDETHLYNRPALRNMYNTIDRNLAKRRLDADPWVLETTTMYRPGEDSIAEGTYKYAQDIQEGKVKHFAGLLFDHRFAQLAPEEFGDESKLRRALYEAYGSVAHSSDGKDYVLTPEGQMQALQSNGATVDGWTLATAEPGPTGDGFVDVDGVMQQIYQPSADINDSIRYFLNSLSSAEDAWLSETEVSSHTVLASEMQHAQRVGRIEDAWQQYVSPDDEITLGFDGSVSHDATALVGCRVRDGLVFLIKLAQRPDDVTAVNWTVDRDSFDGKTRWMFENYNVVACFADAAYFEAMIAGWEKDYPESMKVGPSKTPAMRFYTNTWHQSMFKGLQNMHTSFMYPMEHVPDTADPVRGNVMLLGDRRLVNHFRNARKRDKSYGYLIFKETPKSEKKIDAAMAGTLAYMARQKYLERDQEAPEAVQQIPIRVR